MTKKTMKRAEDVFVLLVETARINMNETSEKRIFPSDSWEVTILSNDPTPPRFHIRRNNWDVSFAVETGERLQILHEDTERNVLDYMQANVKQWLDSPSAILPQITNRENASAQWLQLHG